MLPNALLLLCLAATSAKAQTTSSTSSDSQTTSSTSSDSQTSSGLTTVTIASSLTAITGGGRTYDTSTGQVTITVTSSSSDTSSNGTATASESSSATNSQSTTSGSVIVLGGQSTTSSSGTGTATSTTSSTTATNTVPCNNYAEFCNRKYSNITEVCAHNSAFDIKNNAASNQQLGIVDQLNDGVRMLQGETHYVNDTIYNCHTSCSLLNAGTWQTELETLVGWLKDNPYDVVTFLIVNSDYVNVNNYTAPIKDSGLLPYVYEPTYVPQHRDQWPTLGEMILSGKRVVLFMDYDANQTEVPYILDEFTHMWETPFSPTDQSFPCTEQRPPGLNATLARDEYMYLINHNLDTAISLSDFGISGGGSILIPNTVEINITNGDSDQYGTLGSMAENCTADWGRPPNFLLVDYYNFGAPEEGSVFEVAAKMNGVTYTRKCCGLATSSAPSVRIGGLGKSSMSALAAAIGFAAFLAW